MREVNRRFCAGRESRIGRTPVAAAAILVAVQALAGHASASADGPPPKPAQKISAIKTISWAEPAAEGCDADLEGTDKPARFTLRYREVGKRMVTIDNSIDQLSARGWHAISRSARGMGFDRTGRFAEIDFHIIEQLRCSCEERGKEPEATSEHLVEIKLLWKPGSPPIATARTQKAGGEWEDVYPVTTNGSLPVYDFRFAHPSPGGRPGECSSRFETTLAVAPPIE
jgi:hypothetical protein